MENQEKSKKLDALLKRHEDKAAKEKRKPLIFKAADRVDLITPQFFPSGIAEVDAALGGGIPKGLVTTVWGPYNCGKTWFAMSVAAEITKKGGNILYVDLEGMSQALHLFQEKLGLDLSKVYVLRPNDHGDEIIDEIEGFLYDKEKKEPRNLIDAVIVDSITNLAPKANTDKFDKDGSEGGTKVAAHAKLVADFFNRYYGRGVCAGDQVVILISQQRTNISIMGGPGGPSMQPSGGNPILHDSKVIMKFTKKSIRKLVREEGKAPTYKLLGHEVHVEVEKNHVTGKQGEKAMYVIQYGLGIDDTLSLIKRAEDPEWGYIKNSTPKRGMCTVICPGLGDVVVASKDLPDLIRSRAEIADSLRSSLKGAKPSKPAELIGTEYKIELDEDGDEGSD